MLRAAFVALACVIAVPAFAQSTPVVPDMRVTRIDPVTDPAAIPLYPGMKAGGVVERWAKMFDGLKAVRNVTRPTLTPILPDPAKATGAAVIVIPGGAFQFVSMENEGWPVARWFADRGVAAFVLKYRTNETADDEQEMMAALAKIMSAPAKPGATPAVSEPRATADAQAALAMVQARAREWRVDPSRVGMIGFSAGAMTALNVVQGSSTTPKPAFFGYIYGPMSRIPVGADAPPMFAALALDDPLFGKQGLGIVEAWHEAGRPVELHAYQKGSHGYGMGRTGTTSALMLEELLLWIRTNGWLDNTR